MTGILRQTGVLLVVAVSGLLPAQAQSGPPPRLTGIVISPYQRAAIFESEPGVPKLVKEGEDIAAYTVRSIQPDGVQVERGGQAFTLQPTALGVTAQAMPVDTGGATFGLVVNPRRPAED